jgi:hypothetical protein
VLVEEVEVLNLIFLINIREVFMCVRDLRTSRS